jgi:large subunit ribosomal protein L1
MKRGKKYLESLSKVDRNKTYVPSEAVKLIKDIKYSSYDETVEVHFNLNIDPRHADQQLRGTINLPSGTGKETRVAVVAKDADKVKEALDAGADEAGSEDLIEKIQGGWLGFDILIATPNMMSQVGRLGKLLGSKGLMPNPKVGTVTVDVSDAVKSFKSGKLEYRTDKSGIIHLVIGKLSFDVDALVKNFNMVYDTLLKVKPAKAKGVYMTSVSISSSNGVGVFVDPIKNSAG